jgi:hypothetical protein
MPALRMRGMFRGVDGRELVVERTGWWRGSYEVREGGSVLGRAHRLGIFRRELRG